MMKAWEVTAITNFLAAGEAFLAAGFLLGRAPLAASAAGFWGLTLLFLAAGLLAGGINHGFLEQKDDPRGRVIMQKVTWICAGVMTFFMLLTALYRFAPVEWRAPVALIGLAQFVIYCFFAIRVHSYLVVILNYAPVLLILLALNIAGLPSGSGSWLVITGILISILASLVQALGVDRFSPLDHDGLYHVIVMAAVAFFFAGGLAM